MFESKNSVFILRLLPLFISFARPRAIPLVFLFFYQTLELLLFSFKSHNFSMLLLNIEHDFSLHLSLSFQTLFGLAHLILVRAGLACEFRTDRVFLIKCLILLLSHLN